MNLHRPGEAAVSPTGPPAGPAGSQPIRVYVGGVWHETHSFAADSTGLASFQAYRWLEGEGLVTAFQGTATEIGGALAVLDPALAPPPGPPPEPEPAAAQPAGPAPALADLPLRCQVVPGFYAGALPSGVVEAAAWSQIRQRLLDSVRQARPDAVFLSLHGAMVVAGEPDPEGSLVQAVRAEVGEAVPIGVTLDCHANPSPALVEAADVLAAYDTYPHTDFAERGAEVARLLLRAWAGEGFARALVRLPVVPPVPAQATAASPMRELLALAHAAEAVPGYEVVSWLPGFPYSDVPRLGLSALVVASAGLQAASDLARWLARAGWAVRDRFTFSLVPVAEAVARAAARARSGGGPVVLVDVADNVGGGSPGDGTALLAELLRQRVAGSVVTIADARAVREAAAAGPGGWVALRVGGQTDGWHGEPVCLEGTVRWCGDGTFTLQGSWMRGLAMRPGLTAWVETASGVSVVLSERKVPPFDAGHLRRVGLEPAACRVIVAKSAVAWRAAYGDVAQEAIYVDTPGICTPHLERLPYRHRRRPLLPFEPQTSWADVEVHLFPPRPRREVQRQTGRGVAG